MVVDFPPQSIGEQAVNSVSTSTSTYDAVPNQDITGNRAGRLLHNIPTRLAFEVPTGSPRCTPALTSANGRPGLLDWHLFDRLKRAGITGNSYSGPSSRETWIGTPCGVALSPTAVDG